MKTSPTGPTHLNRLPTSRLESYVTQVLKSSVFSAVSHPPAPILWARGERVAAGAPVASIHGSRQPRGYTPATASSTSRPWRLVAGSQRTSPGASSRFPRAQAECGPAAGASPSASPSCPAAGSARPSIHRLAGRRRRIPAGLRPHRPAFVASPPVPALAIRRICPLRPLPSATATPSVPPSSAYRGGMTHISVFRLSRHGLSAE